VHLMPSSAKRKGILNARRNAGGFLAVSGHAIDQNDALPNDSKRKLASVSNRPWGWLTTASDTLKIRAASSNSTGRKPAIPPCG
jgi:hypothetical protein